MVVHSADGGVLSELNISTAAPLAAGTVNSAPRLRDRVVGCHCRSSNRAPSAIPGLTLCSQINLELWVTLDSLTPENAS